MRIPDPNDGIKVCGLFGGTTSNKLQEGADSLKDKGQIWCRSLRILSKQAKDCYGFIAKSTRHSQRGRSKENSR